MTKGEMRKFRKHFVRIGKPFNSPIPVIGPDSEGNFIVPNFFLLEAGFPVVVNDFQRSKLACHYTVLDGKQLHRSH